MRSFGFSKDRKFKETQVVLALITTTDGLPITYKAFPGNLHEIKTLLPVIEELQKELDVASIDFAADRGMFCATNLAELEKAGINYVVGAKLRNMKEETKEDILAIHEQQEEGKDKYLEMELEHEGRRLLIAYNPARAAKDRRDRQRLLARLGKLAKKSKDGKVPVQDVITNSGSKKYLQLDNADKKASINFAKADSDGAWDGISGYITNSKKPAGEVIANYRRLWVIEDAFRLCKHDLKMRPIFHRKGDRIKAHLDICFITYTLGRQLMYRYRLQQGGRVERVSDIELASRASYDVLRDELAQTEFSLLRHVKSGDLYGVPANPSSIAKRLYRLVGLKCSTRPFKL